MRSFLFIFFLVYNFTLSAQVYPTLSFTENDGLIGNYVWDLLIDKDGLLWIATENGVSIYDGSKFKNYDQTNGLPSRKSAALSMDREGSVYVGCSDGGLVKIKNDTILRCVNDQSDQKHHYRKLHYSNYYKTLFVGTENGLYFLHNQKLVPIKHAPDTIVSPIIFSISSRDHLIFFTVLKGGEEGLYQLYFNQKNPEKSYTKKIYHHGRFSCYMFDHFLLAGEQNKLLKFDLNDLTQEPKSITIDKDFFIWKINSYKSNKLLIGGLGDGRFKGGIFEYDCVTDQLDKLIIKQNNMTITSLLYHPEFDLIWIGKENDLSVFQKTPFKYITPDIPEDFIEVCYTDKQLFILTDLGIYSNKDGDLKSVFYNKWNGYPFINAIHPTLDDQGQIIVHNNNDIIWISKNNFKRIPLKIDMYDLTINDLKKENTFLDNKKLSYQTNHISFHFRVIHFPSAKNFFYRYKINNEGWISGNQVDFQSLRYGKYEITLEVYDKTTKQVYHKEINFQITPPFWDTLWFWVIVIVFISIFIVLLFRWRIKMIHIRTEEKTLLMIQNAELQLRSLQIQMNPHFIFNALNSIQYLVLSKNIKETLTYLGKLAGIIRTNLEFASESSILIREEYEFIDNYIQIELLRFKNKFKFVCKCDGIPEYISIPPMLIQPILENAIKHGIQHCDYPGLIETEFTLQKRILIITITDNGIGRDAASKIETGTRRKHLGLSVIYQRLQLLNDLNHTDAYSLQIIDLNDGQRKTGTQVVLRIPIDMTHHLH